MRAAVVAEFRKIRTTRLWWIMLVCVVVLGGGYAALPAVLSLLQGDATGVAQPFRDPGTLKSIYNGGNTLTRILALVVGVLVLGAEYRHGTLAATYLAVPRRMVVMGAKAVAVVGVGLLYGVASVGMGILVAVPFVLYEHGSLLLGRAEMWRSIGLGVVSIAVWTTIGFAVGMLIRNLVVAMLVGIGFAYIVEPIVSVIFIFQRWNVAANLMPTGATNAMLEVRSPIALPPPDPFTWWQGALVLAGWCLLPAVAGALFTVRRDVA